MAYTTIDKPSEHFSTTLYTGNSTYPRSITGIGFQPDFVWAKNRNVAYWHQLYDAVRGTGTGGGVVYSNGAAGNDDTYKLDSFDSDGFTVGSSLGAINSGGGIVAWCWKGANGTASNTDGDFTTTVSANQTAGFSVLTGTSDSAAQKDVGHGLGKIPDVVFARNLTNAYNWDVWFRTLGYTATLVLNDGSVTPRTGFGSGTVTTTTFSTKDDYSSKNGVKYLYYCMSSIKGFSKISQYIGNGSTSGPFVYTGFKPAMIITKRSDSTGDWRIWDNKRDPENVVDRILYPSAANGEGAEEFGDFLSNGFRPTVTTTDYNASGGVYQYLAFAENPFVTSTGIPATAR